jgi:hypothetical protein
MHAFMDKTQRERRTIAAPHIPVSLVLDLRILCMAEFSQLIRQRRFWRTVALLSQFLCSSGNIIETEGESFKSNDSLCGLRGSFVG